MSLLTALFVSVLSDYITGHSKVVLPLETNGLFVFLALPGLQQSCGLVGAGSSHL